MQLIGQYDSPFVRRVAVALQVGGVLDELEARRAGGSSLWLTGGAITHADIAIGCMLRFVREAHPGIMDYSRWPRLSRHAAQCEALPAFQAVVQPFSVDTGE